MSKCDFRKVAKRLPVDLLHIFRAPFAKNTTGGLHLYKALRLRCLRGSWIGIKMIKIRTNVAVNTFPHILEKCFFFEITLKSKC